MDHNSATYGHTYVGSTYYGTIDDDIRAKVSFRAGEVSSEYDRICVSIFNRVSGKLDGIEILFKDVFSNVKLHIWERDGGVGWYYGTPSKEDYKIMQEQIVSYLRVFMP